MRGRLGEGGRGAARADSAGRSGGALGGVGALRSEAWECCWGRMGAPKVADFGVAAAHDDAADGESGHEGRRVGNLAFIAPEQYRAEPGAIAPAADIYALGGMLYYLLTDALPNGRDGGSDRQDAREHRREAGAAADRGEGERSRSGPGGDRASSDGGAAAGPAHIGRGAGERPGVVAGAKADRVDAAGGAVDGEVVREAAADGGAGGVLLVIGALLIGGLAGFRLGLSVVDRNQGISDEP